MLQRREQREKGRQTEQDEHGDEGSEAGINNEDIGSRYSPGTLLVKRRVVGRRDVVGDGVEEEESGRR